MRLNKELIRDKAKIATFAAMRSQSRPSVDSRSSIENPDANEHSPLEHCHKGANRIIRVN